MKAVTRTLHGRRSVITAVMGVLAAAALVGAEAQENPMLVEYLPEATGPPASASEPMESALNRLRNAPEVMALRIGRAAPEPVVRARGLSIALPESGEVVSIDDLVVEELEPGYALYSRDQRSTTRITFVVMGEDLVGTLHHDGAAYGLAPLGGGLTGVYRYDPGKLRGPPGEEEDFIIPDIAPEGSSLLPRNPPAASDPRDRIDVLVVYTRSVGRSIVNVDARIALLVLKTNLQ